ncbi:MAG: hypothetical protein ACNS60_05370 [Candidatus Cyclobacteriaceae bacterium M2_1C_046]
MKTLGCLLFLCLLLTSCSSGKKAYEEGNYYEAVIKATNRLRKNPDHKKSKQTLKAAYPLAIGTMESDADQMLNSADPMKYSNAIRIYEQLNRLNNEIKHAPGALKVIKQPVDYFYKIEELKPLAAENAYNNAEELMALKTREAAKNAYYLYTEADNFVPGYKDVANKIEEAQFQATLKVMVHQIPVPTQYELSSRFFQDNVEEYLRTRFRSNQFVRFYTPIEAESLDLPYIDHYLDIAFDDFTVGNIYIKEKEETVSKDSVKVGEIELESGEKKPVYGTVNAKVTTFKKEVLSRGRVSMQIRDAETKALLSHKKFDGEFIWISEWGNFNGDERALSDIHLAIVKKKEVPPPPPQDMFVEFTRPIYSQLTQNLESFYSRY